MKPKLYVLPVERACNASCDWCITDFRETAGKEFLAPKDLDNAITNIGWISLHTAEGWEGKTFRAIEITGGGEPLIHPKLERIVKRCCKEAKTRIYTNGALLAQRADALQGVAEVCISRAHHDDRENERIMGIDYDWERALAASPAPVKASLLLHRNGICTQADAEAYLEWLAQSGVRKAVIRQLFEQDGKRYNDLFAMQQVSTKGLYESWSGQKAPKRGNPKIEYRGVHVEFELRSCARETQQPVLHADGRVYNGWTRQVALYREKDPLRPPEKDHRGKIITM